MTRTDALAYLVAKYRLRGVQERLPRLAMLAWTRGLIEHHEHGWNVAPARPCTICGTLTQDVRRRCAAHLEASAQSS